MLPGRACSGVFGLWGSCRGLAVLGRCSTGVQHPLRVGVASWATESPVMLHVEPGITATLPSFPDLAESPARATPQGLLPTLQMGKRAGRGQVSHLPSPRSLRTLKSRLQPPMQMLFKKAGVPPTPGHPKNAGKPSVYWNQPRALPLGGNHDLIEFFLLSLFQSVLLFKHSPGSRCCAGGSP